MTSKLITPKLNFLTSNSIRSIAKLAPFPCVAHTTPKFFVINGEKLAGMMRQKLAQKCRPIIRANY